LIGFEILPSAFVDDPGYTSKIQQVREQPYYYLVRRRFWEKIYDKRLLAGVDERIETTARIGTSVIDTKQIETTIGVVVSAKVSGKFGTGKSTSSGPIGTSKEVSAELAAQFSWQKKELDT